jgi:hypothetical protein
MLPLRLNLATSAPAGPTAALVVATAITLSGAGVSRVTLTGSTASAVRFT